MPRAAKKAGSSGSSEEDLEDAEDAVSTSSDEKIAVGRAGKGKRQRKYYQPDEDALFQMEEDSESAIELEDSEESVELVQGKKANTKRRKSLDGSEMQAGSETDQEYDEDEAALQQALALSLATTPEQQGGTVSIPQPSSSRRDALDNSRRKYDPEEHALQQALAASMTEAEGVLDGMRVSDANGREPAATRSPATTLKNKAGSCGKGSKPIAIDGHDSVEKGSAKSKGRKKQMKPAFEPPSVAMVQQAFDMLDPRGHGRVDPRALQQVASKLLHKELDRDQLDAMMEFAQSMASKNGEGIPGVLDAEGFCRLCARFADPPTD